MRVVVNAAMSADGKLAGASRTQVAISGPADFDRVDALRAESDAVLVGIGTVLADDPSLTVGDPDRIEAREADGHPGQPARVVLDSRARTPRDARVLDDTAPTHVVVAASASTERRDRLAERGVTIHVAGDDRVDIEGALAALGEAGIGQVMVEGGGEVIYSMLAAEVVDELLVFVGPLVIGGRESPTLVDGDGFTEPFPSLELREVSELDGGVLLRWRPE